MMEKFKKYIRQEKNIALIILGMLITSGVGYYIFSINVSTEILVSEGIIFLGIMSFIISLVMFVWALIIISKEHRKVPYKFRIANLLGLVAITIGIVVLLSLIGGLLGKLIYALGSSQLSISTIKTIINIINMGMWILFIPIGIKALLILATADCSFSMLIKSTISSLKGFYIKLIGVLFIFNIIGYGINLLTFIFEEVQWIFLIFGLILEWIQAMYILYVLMDPSKNKNTGLVGGVK